MDIGPPTRSSGRRCAGGNHPHIGITGRLAESPTLLPIAELKHVHLSDCGSRQSDASLRGRPLKGGEQGTTAMWFNTGRPT